MLFEFPWLNSPAESQWDTVVLQLCPWQGDELVTTVCKKDCIWLWNIDIYRIESLLAFHFNQSL